MGSQGGNAPNPYTQRQLRTAFLRVPFGDWPAVKQGLKTEFRALPAETAHIRNVLLPTAVVAYTVSARGEYDKKLMTLVDRWQEPIMVIAERPESLAREGFETYDHFRRYWRKRRHGVYRPMQIVTVFRVEPWDGARAATLGLMLLRTLYGEHME